MSVRTAKKARKSPAAKDDMRPEYDFSHGARGKYVERYRAGPVTIVFVTDDPKAPAAAPDARRAAPRRKARKRTRRARKAAGGR